MSFAWRCEVRARRPRCAGLVDYQFASGSEMVMALVIVWSPTYAHSLLGAAVGDQQLCYRTMPRTSVKTRVSSM